MPFKTADLCDHYGDVVQIVEEELINFGGRDTFSGEIETVRTFEDNSLVRECLGRNGEGKVLVVDGGGSFRRALLGDNLAVLAIENGWSGVVINGCIRDAGEIMEMDLGVLALGTHPRKTDKRGFGDHNVTVRFGGVVFEPGAHLYADDDGVVVSPQPLTLPG